MPAIGDSPLPIRAAARRRRADEARWKPGASEILYRLTAEDPLLYTQAWTAETAMRRSPDRMSEYACHEGNYGLPNIPSGGRVMKRRGVKGG